MSFGGRFKVGDGRCQGNCRWENIELVKAKMGECSGTIREAIGFRMTKESLSLVVWKGCRGSNVT